MVEEHSPEIMRRRTRRFALSIIKLFKTLPLREEARILGRQMLRSGTSVGAHYHEATRSRSRAEFISKLEGGLQELDETVYWLTLLKEANVINGQLDGLLNEADELTAILVASAKTAKLNKRQ
ncbi:four helix bundle protein [Sulfuriflexus sp.]|uniref:four helix bundle protein n=1 Tax=Sulfuriflexus sp. TaxID=2015443 RepID=UPI0026011E97|nr:four helix bundle protein [Sulfuriflexus sp.]MDT8404847.1 four helix bundle protein [Sulfuriflexus sp.]